MRMILLRLFFIAEWAATLAEANGARKSATTGVKLQLVDSNGGVGPLTVAEIDAGASWSLRFVFDTPGYKFGFNTFIF